MVFYCMSMNGNINRLHLAPSASGLVFTPKKPTSRESYPSPERGVPVLPVAIVHGLIIKSKIISRKRMKVSGIATFQCL